jgi:enoyl-CoA hydratase/carnithine racemase
MGVCTNLLGVYPDVRSVNNGRFKHNLMTSNLVSQAPQLHVSQSVATITLHRPQHRNRLEDGDLLTLLEHIAAVNADASVRALVLTAQPNQPRPVFSAGYHLGAFREDGETGPMPFETVPDALASARPLTLCALPGSVYGGATDLALACDFRFGVEGMELRMPAGALGLHYYPSGMQRYVARLGLGVARKLFLLAETVPDRDLLQLGFLDKLLPASELAGAVQTWCAQVLAMGPLAVQGMKQTLNEIALGWDQPALWREREATTKASADFAEGRQAFAERRAPRFEGR